MRRFIPSCTKEIFFHANFFSQCRHLKNNWNRIISADLFPSGDLMQGVLKALFFLIAVFCGAGGPLFLCSGGASSIIGLPSPVLSYGKYQCPGICIGLFFARPKAIRQKFYLSTI
jgi:hypothetical protein